MRATGIVRRIDDLGRIAIPKEIRRTMQIREGEALEMYVDTVNGVPCLYLAKYERGFSKDLNDVFEKIHTEMTDCAKWDLATEFRLTMEKAAEILDKFENRE